MASSGTVTANTSSVLASQYNNLRNDVLNISTGHIHSGSADCGKQLESASYGALSVLQAAVQRGALWMLTRQGGAVDNWNQSGTIQYSTTTTGMDGQLVVTGGAYYLTIGAGNYSAQGTITYQNAFAYSPLLYATAENIAVPFSNSTALHIVSITAPTVGNLTTAYIRATRPATMSLVGAAGVYINWLAIGIQA